MDSTLLSGIIAAAVAVVGFVLAPFIPKWIETHAEQKKEQQSRLGMHSFKNMRTFMPIYRNAVHNDKRITSWQILGMDHPLKVDAMYVKLRLATQRMFSANDFSLHDQTKSHDPEAWLEIMQRHLDQRVGKTVAVDETSQSDKLLNLADGHDPETWSEIMPQQLDQHQHIRKTFTLEEALQNYQHLVVIGDPGAGKSTLLRYTMLQGVDGKLRNVPKLPVYIELGEMAFKQCTDFLDFAATSWEKRYRIVKDDALRIIKTELANDHVMFLLDALDETFVGDNMQSAQLSYRHMSQLIIDFASRYDHVPIIVTARKENYQRFSTLRGFDTLELVEFQIDDMEQFILNWFAAAGSSVLSRDKMLRLIDILTQNRRFRTLASNPLLLTLIILAYQEDLELPAKRSKIYERCINLFFSRWDAQRGIIRPKLLSSDDKQLLLDEIAWHFHSQCDAYFSKTDLTKIIKEFLYSTNKEKDQVNKERDQVEAILNELTSVHGLLKEQAPDIYSFLHFSLQEYFAAHYAFANTQSETLLTHIGDPWWEEVILLYASSLPDVSPLLEKLLEYGQSPYPQEDVFYANLVLAGRCLATGAPVRHRDQRQEVVERLFKVLQHSPYLLLQSRIASVLLSISDNTAHDTIKDRLLSLFNEPETNYDYTLLGNIASGLSSTGDIHVIKELIALLPQKHINRYVRGNIALSLEKTRKRSIAKQLFTLVQDDTIDWYVREKLIMSSANLAGMEAAPELWTLLQDSHMHESLRRRSAMELGLLGCQMYADEMFLLLTNDEPDVSKYIRGGIALALGMLADKRCRLHMLDWLDNASADIYLQRSIVTALAMTADSNCLQRMTQLLKRPDVDLMVKISITNALATRNDAAMRQLLPLMTSTLKLDQNTLACLAILRGALQDKMVIPVLLTMLRNNSVHHYLREQIAEVLSKFRAPLVTQSLLQCLKDPSVHRAIRKSSATSLGEIGDASVVPDLFPLLMPDTGTDMLVCEGIVRALSMLIQDQSELDQLAALLDKSSDVGNCIYTVLWEVSQRLGERVFYTSQLPS